jgi:RNA polymerase sigma-70 factor (ECF subfamily)
MAKIETIDKEKELLLKVANGDKEAFGQLYDFYAPKVFRFVRLKVRSQALAEDLSSESFLRIWEYLQKEGKKVEQSFQALLYTIARNLIIDFYRKKSSQELSLDDDFIKFLALNRPIGDEKRDLELKEQIYDVHKSIMDIKEEYQDVIILYYVDELSVAEIAEIMGKSQGAIRVLIHRALRSLKKRLEEA